MARPRRDKSAGSMINVRMKVTVMAFARPIRQLVKVAIMMTNVVVIMTTNARTGERIEEGGCLYTIYCLRLESA